MDKQICKKCGSEMSRKTIERIIKKIDKGNYFDIETTLEYEYYCRECELRVKRIEDTHRVMDSLRGDTGPDTSGDYPTHNLSTTYSGL